MSMQRLRIKIESATQTQRGNDLQLCQRRNPAKVTRLQADNRNQTMKTLKIKKILPTGLLYGIELRPAWNQVCKKTLPGSLHGSLLVESLL